MMVADALAPDRHLTICRHRADSTVQNMAEATPNDDQDM